MLELGYSFLLILKNLLIVFQHLEIIFGLIKASFVAHCEILELNCILEAIFQIIEDSMPYVSSIHYLLQVKWCQSKIQLERRDRFLCVFQEIHQLFYLKNLIQTSYLLQLRP